MAAARLDRPIGAGWAVTDEGLSFDPRSRLLIGERANRSRERYTINGRSVYVLEQGGAPWTVGDALDTLSAFAEVESERVRRQVGDKHVICGLSGGVDSSVVAALLAREGYDVVGVTLQLYEGNGNPSDSEYVPVGGVIPLQQTIRTGKKPN